MLPSVFFLMQCAVLAYALVGGVFLAFSDFIMRSLARDSEDRGAEVMRVINREVFRWVFMSLFLGMSAASVGIAVYAAVHLTGPGQSLILLSALVYLVGCFGVTLAFNVPMNEALAALEPSQAANQYWTDTYLPRWTFWNTVRTFACVLSAALLLFGLFRMARATVF